jgi:ATP:ADP antiporter, AAA family
MHRRLDKAQSPSYPNGKITCLMFLYIAGVLAFYYILKPMRSSLFLKDLPAGNLPNAYLLTALLAGPVVTLMFKLSGRLSLIALITSTNLAIIGSLLFFQWAVAAQVAFLPYLYFAYVQIVSVLCVSQFWLLAGYVYDQRQAKRIYGLLAAGGIAGSIAGSLVTDIFKSRSTAAMLSICIGICIALIVLAHVIWRQCSRQISDSKESPKYLESSERSLDMLRMVFGSRLLRLMVLLVFLTMIASQIADWQVDYAAQEKFKHLPNQLMEQEIKSFRARFNMATNIIGIVLQLSVTQFVIQRIGVWAAILFLPIGVGASALGVIFNPTLTSTTIALGCNSVFRSSIHRSGFELFFLPLSPDMRKKVKVFIDVFVDRIGRAGAAFIIISLTAPGLPIGLPGTASALVLLTGVCIVVSLKLRKDYVDAFRQQLIRREVDLSEVRRYVTDPASLRLLAATLESSQERQILYALGLLQSARGFDFSPQLLPLLRHPSSYIREEAVHSLHALPGNHEADAKQMLNDESDAVRNAVVEYLCLYDPAKTEERIRQFLDDVNPEIRFAAACCVLHQPASIFRPSIDMIRCLMALDGKLAIQAHELAAGLAARLPSEESVPLLRSLIRDSRWQVSAGAIAAAGHAGHAELVSDIMPLLFDRKLRAASRQALVSLGLQVTIELGAVLGNENADPVIRHEIPWILARIKDSSAAGILVENLNAGDATLKYQIVKALSRMHAGNHNLPGNRRIIEMHLIAQIMAYYEGLALCQGLESKRKAAGNGLASRSVRERLNKQLEMIFRLLGIIYPQKDIYFAYAALKGTSNNKRMSAIEFLDDFLGKDIKSLILPLLEESEPKRLLARAMNLFNIRIPEHERALETLLLEPDPWLKTCALHAAGSDRISALEPQCRQLVRHRDPLVRETALWALERLNQIHAVGISL